MATVSPGFITNWLSIDSFFTWSMKGFAAFGLHQRAAGASTLLVSVGFSGGAVVIGTSV